MLKESFNGGGNSASYCVLMRKKDWKDWNFDNFGALVFNRMADLYAPIIINDISIIKMLIPRPESARCQAWGR